MTIHYRYMDGGLPRIACGAGENRPNTNDHHDVTCGRCAKTDAYTHAAWLASQTYTTEQVERMVNEAKQKVVEVIGKAANEWAVAVDKGYCGDCDEGINHINMLLSINDLPLIPPRVVKWSIEIAYGGATVEALTEDEAWEQITQNPSEYLSLYQQ